MKLSLLNITSIDFDFNYIEHFAKHYSQFDIDEWHIILQTNYKDCPKAAKAKFSKYHSNITFYYWDGEFWSTPTGTDGTVLTKIDRFNGIIAERKGFILLADVDEFHLYPTEPKLLLKKGIIGGMMYDRFKEGRLPGHLKNTNIFKQFPIEDTYSKDVLEVWQHKPCLFHKGYKLINSHELTQYDEKVDYSVDIKIAHFKWTDTTKMKLIKRVETYYKKAHWEESVKALKDIYDYKHPLSK